MAAAIRWRCGMLDTVNPHRILHISRRELIQKLRDQILRIHGFDVDSTVSASEAVGLAERTSYSLVLIDVEGPDGVTEAEHLCAELKKIRRDQHIAFVCNHRVSLKSDCPDEIIRAEFNPDFLIRSVREAIEGS
jgi:DNA-binding NtrC family response regulator